MSQDNDPIRAQIYLAALLHDIGKFYQRADIDLERNTLIGIEAKKITDLICTKTEKGQADFNHIVWLHQFLLNKERKLTDSGFVLDHFNEDSCQRDDLINLSVFQHNPNTFNQAIIKLSDSWAGETYGKFQDENIADVRENQNEKVAMINIFSTLNVEKKTSPKANVFNIGELSLNRNSIFPVSVEKSINSQKEYAFLWNKFDSDFDKLPVNDKSAFLNSLLYLLKQYTWSIPASSTEGSVCSLYSHLKTTAAIALSLYDYAKENDAFTFDGTELQIKKEKQPLVLLCVDISGIQKYIYDITSKNAAKSLRGRSFSLQVMIESIAFNLMNQLDCFAGNIIYSSGGKFYALLPNTVKVAEGLRKYENDLQKKLWREFKTGLYLGFAAVPFSYDMDAKDKKGNVLIEGGYYCLGDLWRIVVEKTAKKKKKKYFDLILNNSFYDEFFSPQGKAGDTSICGVTGEEGELEALSREEDGNGNSSILVSKQVKQEIDVGNSLAKYKYLVLGDLRNGFPILGNKFAIEKDIDSRKYKNCQIFKIVDSQDNSIHFLQDVYSDNSFGFRFYGGSSVPLRNEKIATFEDFVESDDLKQKAEGGGPSFSRLAILRMDIDSLGKLFIEGFDKKEQSFSALSTLSGLLDLFFSGYINTIRNQDKYKDYINIIYSGGDDIFIVGKWDLTIEFAWEIKREFRDFVGRGDITISAGIVLVDPKFPIAKAAIDAGIAEDKAKSHEFRGQQKNSICLFGIPLNWDKEWELVVEWKDKFLGWLDNKYITKGLLMQFFSYYEMSIQENENRYRWKWLAVYNLSKREKEIKEEDIEKKEVLEELKRVVFEQIFESKFRFDAFIVACRWAELLDRNKNTDINSNTNGNE